MANIPGIIGFLEAGAFSRVQTIQRSVSVPGGPRVACIMGEGERTEVLVDSASGFGRDGLDSDFIGFGNPDGRHFQLSTFPLVENRLQLFFNGTPLKGEEASIQDGYDGGPIPDEFDYRVDPENGRIILQNARLRNFGTSTSVEHALPRSTNKGEGFVSAPTFDAYGAIDGYEDNQVNLLDEDAPSEVWTLRAVQNAVVADTGSTTITAAEFITALTTNGGPGYILLDDRNQSAATFTLTIDAGSPLSISAFASDADGFPVTLDAATGRLIIDSSVVTGDVSGTSYVANYSFTDTITSFTLTGSVSGLSVDPVTNAPLIWFSNGVPQSNGILQFAVNESRSNTAVDFAINDSFTIQVDSRKLNTRDTLEARYLAEPDINDVQLFSDLSQVFTKHGNPSTTNTLSLGAQMAFENGAEQVFAIQPKPPVARRTTETPLLSAASPSGSGASGGTASSDLIFKIENGQPDFDTNVNISILSDTNPNVRNQIFPQKIEFYQLEFGDGEATVEAAHAAFAALHPLSAYTVAERTNLTTGKTETHLFLSPDLALSAGQGLSISYIDERDADFFDAGWAEAFEELEKFDPYYIVPLPCKSFSLIQRNAVEHAKQMSDIRHRKERIAVTGTPLGVTVDALLGLELIAFEDIGIIEGIQGDDLAELAANNDEDLQDLSVERNFGDTFRLIWAWPDEIVRTVAGFQQKISGIFLGAAIAGRMSRRTNLAEPLTNRILTGFNILRDKVETIDIIRLLGDAGVTVIEPVTGGGQVKFGLTTVQNGIAEEEEPSVVDIRDFVARASRIVMEERFVGTPFDRTTIGSAKVVITNLLESLRSQGLIQNVANLSVTKDPIEPRQLNVRFAIEPTFPVNWVFIDISVGLL